MAGLCRIASRTYPGVQGPKLFKVDGDAMLLTALAGKAVIQA